MYHCCQPLIHILGVLTQDQRSIKVIERTAVPVIKVSTKDVRSRVVQLDLSFDAKEHHGLEALNMIQHILEVSGRRGKLSCRNDFDSRPYVTSQQAGNANGSTSRFGSQAIST